jgi:hypothetical protein
LWSSINTSIASRCPLLLCVLRMVSPFDLKCGSNDA